MTFLSIFNNGSQAWILLIIDIIWVIVFGTKAYLSHKSGYHKQLPNGSYVDTPPSLLSNSNFILLITGFIGWTAFLIWINSAYAK